MKKKWNALALVSLFAGLVPLAFFLVERIYLPFQYLPVFDLIYPLAVLSPFMAIALGHLAYWKMKRQGCNRPWVAVAGALLGYFWIAWVIFYPHPIRESIRGNDSAAVGTLRTIYTAAHFYADAHSSQLPATLRQLGEADIVDDNVANGVKSGYRFTYKLSNSRDGKPNGFEAIAEPIRQYETGVRYFYIDETGIVRVEANKRPTTKSAQLL